MFRIATNKDALGESPWQDIMGYALLSFHKQIRDKNALQEDTSEKKEP